MSVLSECASCSLKVVWEAIEHRSAVVDAARVKPDYVKVLRDLVKQAQTVTVATVEFTFGCCGWLSLEPDPAESTV